ncbi:hypothetical protein V8G54_010451 [Vigna mungo]|uniref:Uncharacterized protein n=1 Tax=Vigna mungo TaxID=3915 RepID=A0AAQ3S327_VIGMU
MEFWKLFFVALMPVLKVLLITALGTILAIDRFNMLGQTARKNLNTMVYFVFYPTLVCSNLAETITLRSVVRLWFMPVNILLTFVIGTVIGLLLVKLTRVPNHLHGLVLGCCAAGNLGNLPIIIVPAVCKQSGNPFGDVNVCTKNALAYASLSMALGSVYTWSYAYHLVRLYASKFCNEAKIAENSMENPMSITKTDAENPSTCSTGSPFVSVVGDKSQSPDHVKNFEIHCTNSDHGKTRESFTGTKRENDHGTFENIDEENEPEDSIHTLHNWDCLNGVGKQFAVIVGISVMRCIVLPGIGVGIVKGAIRLGFIHPDPLYHFLLLLQFAVPPAVALSKFSIKTKPFYAKT